MRELLVDVPDVDCAEDLDQCPEPNLNQMISHEQLPFRPLERLYMTAEVIIALYNITHEQQTCVSEKMVSGIVKQGTQERLQSLSLSVEDPVSSPP